MHTQSHNQQDAANLMSARQIACRLPLTMAMPLTKAFAALDGQNYKETLIRFLDFFEMSVQWLNCYFLGLAATVPDAGRHKGILRAVKIIDAKRPLSFGDCVNEIFNPLLDSMMRLFPDHPLVCSLTANVKTRKTDILTGSAKEQGVIKIRNDYKGHSTSLSEVIYRDVVEIILPKVEAMSRGLSPLADATVYAGLTSGMPVDLRGGWKPLDGESAGSIQNGCCEPGHYYVAFKDYATIDLYPLALQHDDRYIYIFQTLKGEAVKYESSDDNVHGFETEGHNGEFDAFMQRILPSFDIAKDANWEELCESMRQHSTAYMIQVQKEKKYSSELFVDRVKLTELLENFSASGATLLPLAGDAGQGKTNQMCNWTERFLDTGTPVLVFNSAAFSDASLSDTLKALFGFSHRRPLGRLLDHLHAKADEKGQNVYFFFDAINECLHYKTDGSESKEVNNGEIAPLLLFGDIVGNLVQPCYPRFKVVSTCRSYTWKNQILPEIELPCALVYGGDEDDGASIVGFSDAEAETAYRKYDELYQMATPFEELDRRIMLRLRDPLIMKFVCSNYVGAQLSAKTDDYTSVSLFSKMVSDIRDHSFAGNLQCRLLDELARILMLSYLNGRPAGSVTNAALRQAYDDKADPLHKLARMIYKKDGLTVAYTELRNKPDRPMLREVEKTVDGEKVRAVEFIYERFLEYMLARAFLAEEEACGRPVTAETFVKAFATGTVNVVFLGAMRNALIMEIIRSGDFKIVMELVQHHSSEQGIMQLVNEMFEVMIRENYEGLLFSLLETMMGQQPDDKTLIGNFNAVKREIASNKATPETIVRHNELSARLQPIVNLRTAVGVAVNNLLLSDFFNEDLYTGDVLGLLWGLIMDEIDDVSNETCKFVYYLSRRTHTHSHTPLKGNQTKHIVQEMYRTIKARTIAGNMIRADERRKCIVFTEAATRLAVLLIIDATIAPRQDVDMISEMLKEIRGIAGYFTWNYRLVRLVMPFLQPIMRKQITFQSVYVNNAVEYQGFWNNDVVPYEASADKWSRKRLREAMEFVHFYNRHHATMASDESQKELKRFVDFLPVVLSAYSSGCSFTYFIVERLMIIVGSADWKAVKPAFDCLLGADYRDFEWFDYMQMSLLYDLFQLEVNLSAHNPEILEVFTREARDWTLRCRGLFKARHSHKANAKGLYKRNVINWYCVVYCAHSGDNVAHDGDSRPVPLLYELIDLAVRDNDKELLMHLLDNISELISDFGYVNTALAALKYVMQQYETPQSVESLDARPCPGGRFAEDTLVNSIGSVLSTSKTYFPSETDAFLHTDVIGLRFPGVENYREEILNYHTGGETLSDLFTHKFGNFLLWGLLHEQAVDDFAYEAVCAAVDAKDCFAWFDQVIRILCRRMFNVKI